MNTADTFRVEVIAPIDSAPFTVGDTLTIDRTRGVKQSTWVLAQHDASGYGVVMRSCDAMLHEGLWIVGGAVEYTPRGVVLS
jgi:hypothetical protein